MNAQIPTNAPSSYSNAKLERDAWIQFAEQMQPGSFLTLKFRLEVPEGATIFSDRELQRYFTLLKPEQALRIANELLLRMHQRLFRRRKGEQLSGIGCIESQRSGMPHIHLLIANDIEAARIKEIADRVICSARSHGKPFFLVDEDSVDVRDVFDSGGAGRYISKLYEHRAAGEQMLLLHGSALYA